MDEIHYLHAVEPQSLHRPLKPSQQCFQQPEPHFVTSAGVREPGKKNWGGVVLSSSTFDESNILLWISVPKNYFLTLVNDISRDRNYFIEATILISSLSYDLRIDRSYKCSRIALIRRSIDFIRQAIRLHHQQMDFSDARRQVISTEKSLPFESALAVVVATAA